MMQTESSFTDQKPHQATAYQASLKHWCCANCGHHFKEGNTFRWIYGNGRTLEIDGKKFGLSNFLVCETCDGPDETLRDREVEFQRRYGWRFMD